MNHVHEDLPSGKLISSTSLDVLSPPPGMSVIWRPDGEESGIWNPSTLVFDPRPEDKREPSDVFWNRFSESEQENLTGAATTNDKAAALLKAMSYPSIDRGDSRIISRVNAMELAGKLDSPGRAAEILA